MMFQDPDYDGGVLPGGVPAEGVLDVEEYRGREVERAWNHTLQVVIE